MFSICKGGIYEEFVNSKKFSLPEGEGGAARRAGETEGQMCLPQGGLSSGDAPPIFFSVLPEKKTGRARSKRKGRFGRNFAHACKVAIRGST